MEFRLEAEADDLRALSSLLFNLSNRVAAADLSAHSVSGGYDSGYAHWLTVSDTPTHEEYVRQLNAYIETLNADGDQP